MSGQNFGQNSRTALTVNPSATTSLSSSLSSPLSTETKLYEYQPLLYIKWYGIELTPEKLLSVFPPTPVWLPNPETPVPDDTRLIRQTESKTTNASTTTIASNPIWIQRFTQRECLPLVEFQQDDKNVFKSGSCQLALGSYQMLALHKDNTEKLLFQFDPKTLIDTNQWLKHAKLYFQHWYPGVKIHHEYYVGNHCRHLWLWTGDYHMKDLQLLNQVSQQLVSVLSYQGVPTFSVAWMPETPNQLGVFACASLPDETIENVHEILDDDCVTLEQAAEDLLEKHVQEVEFEKQYLEELKQAQTDTLDIAPPGLAATDSPLPVLPNEFPNKPPHDSNKDKNKDKDKNTEKEDKDENDKDDKDDEEEEEEEDDDEDEETRLNTMRTLTRFILLRFDKQTIRQLWSTPAVKFEEQDNTVLIELINGQCFAVCNARILQFQLAQDERVESFWSPAIEDLAFPLVVTNLGFYFLQWLEYTDQGTFVGALFRQFMKVIPELTNNQQVLDLYGQIDKAPETLQLLGVHILQQIDHEWEEDNSGGDNENNNDSETEDNVPIMAQQTV